ncbi:hypothetical protein HRI_000948000 [Hibiscus trionum]|uniref:LysM domain-containing protein n=1 Tax=Hibiscus trionum TaxID=183268 RepID=A0A9W7H883_HIBTR|nr:hypothetical protein HRI_000948000 [Hibiscus trionum]
MAKSNHKTSMLTILVLIIAVLVLVSMAESRGLGFPKKSLPSCSIVYGVQSGDTCFGVSQAFNLTTTFFGSVNPNLDCDSLFVGQWLCVVGTA